MKDFEIDELNKIIIKTINELIDFADKNRYNRNDTVTMGASALKAMSEISDFSDYKNDKEDLLPVSSVRPNGKWIEKEKTAGYIKWECDNCSSTFKNPQKPWYLFCPKCGANMKAESEDKEGVSV